MNARWTYYFVLPSAFIVLWYAVSAAHIYPVYIIPPLGMVLGSFAEQINSGTLFQNIYWSIVRVIAGFAIAALIGIPLGIGMGWSNSLMRLVEPLTNIIRQIPPIAWVPFAMIWFRAGVVESSAFIVFIGAFFPILLNTISGVKGVPVLFIESAYTLGASSRQILTKVVLPASMPSILSGLRIGLGIGWMSLVAAEMMGQDYGLGSFIINSSTVLRMDRVVVGMITIGLLGFLMDRIFKGFESSLLSWRGR
ncbi:MAG TPA: ABC transporter permease [Candidatus Methanoperedenaceae archaeon]|nr:ABC transporter permease [Candidatus Methanoperedenaceae archaeon]